MKKLITKEEKDLLIKKRIEKIDSSNKYAKELFSIWFKENPKENLEEWKTLTYEKKYKIVKEIVAKEHKEFLRVSLQTHKLNLKNAMGMARNLINDQLKELKIR